MFFLLVGIIRGIIIYVSCFDKKLSVLLSLEIMMILIIVNSSWTFFSNNGLSSFFSSMFFLIFMVLDSVLGICLLICSSRSSSSLSCVKFSF